MSTPDRLNNDDLLRLVEALQAPPEIVVPDDFSTRVMARLPHRPQRRYVLRHALYARADVGRKLAFAALLVLVAGMLVLAPHTRGSETFVLLQSLLFVQLAALLLWMGISYKRLL